MMYYYSPAGVCIHASRARVEAYIKAGGDMASRRLTNAAMDAAKRAPRGKGFKKRAKV